MAIYALLLPIVLICGLVIPRTALAVALGFLLPIDVFAGVDSLVLDLLRYGLAGLLIARSLEKSVQVTQLNAVARATAACLVGVFSIGLFKLALTTGSGGISSVPVVGLVSVIIATYLAKDIALRRSLLAGFVVGALANAIDIHLQVFGLPFFGTESAWGTRYAGLTFSSTNTAPFLALALVLTIMPPLWERANPSSKNAGNLALRMIAAVILASGLLMSGGRGGVLGFAVAILVLVANSVRNNHLLTGAFLILVPAGIIIFREDISRYISRDGRSLDITSGRAERNSAAWEVLSQNWISGIPFKEAGGFNPHTPILLFGLQFGIVGFLAAILVTSFLLYAVLAGAGKNGTHLLMSMMAAIMLVTALLEPLGFYVGLAKTTLLLIVLTIGEPNGTFGPAKPVHGVAGAPRGDIDAVPIGARDLNS